MSAAGRSDVHPVEILDRNIEGMKLLNSLSMILSSCLSLRSRILRLDNSKYLQ